MDVGLCLPVLSCRKKFEEKNSLGRKMTVHRMPEMLLLMLVRAHAGNGMEIDFHGHNPRLMFGARGAILQADI